MAYLAIVTALALLVYIVAGAQVSRARGKYGIKAPATSGHDVFDRTFRVHQNTLEQLALFLPALWLFGTFVSSTWGAALGLVFVIGRILYMQAYVGNPDKRGLGFAVGFGANVILLLGGLIGALMAAFDT